MDRTSHRSRAVQLIKRCPQCGGLGEAEAKLPISASLRPPRFDLDDVNGLMEGQSLGLLLALVELLPYKQFTCPRCDYQFRLASHTALDMVKAMLGSMQPVAAEPPVHHARQTATPARLYPAKPHATGTKTRKPASRPASATADWDPESLDNLLDYTPRPTGKPR